MEQWDYYEQLLRHWWGWSVQAVISVIVGAGLVLVIIAYIVNPNFSWGKRYEILNFLAFKAFIANTWPVLVWLLVIGVCFVNAAYRDIHKLKSEQEILAKERDDLKVQLASASQITQSISGSENVQIGGDLNVNTKPPPRRIQGNTKTEWVDELERCQSKVLIWAKNDDPEASQFAQDIFKVLDNAGWDFQGEPIRYSQFFFNGPPTTGIIISVQGEPGMPKNVPNTHPVVVLLHKLTEQGFKVKIKLKPTQAEDLIELTVYSQPTPQ